MQEVVTDVAASTTPTRQPLVLLPGMLCSPRLWDPVRSLLSASADLRDIALEGESIDDMVEHVLATAPPRFDLAGLSLGGIVAMALTQRAPRRVRRLVLLSTNARAPRDDQRTTWQQLEREVKDGRFMHAGLGTLDAWGAGVEGGRRVTLRAVTAAMARDVGPERFVEQLRAQATRWDLRPGLAGLLPHTLVVAGADDTLCPPSVHREIAGLVPRSHLQVVPDCGHLSTLERPDEVAEHLTTFLEKTPDHGERDRDDV